MDVKQQPPNSMAQPGGDGTNSSSATTQRSTNYSTTEARSEKIARDSQWGGHPVGFFSKTAEMVEARKVYFVTFISGTFLVVLTIAMFSLFWGSLLRVPAHPLKGWIVDFDSGEVGEFFSQNILSLSNNAIVWSMYRGDEVGTLENMQCDITEERAWVAVVINSGTSNRLNQELQSPSSSYNGSLAITVYVNEARNENAYRVLIHPTVTRMLDQLSQQFAIQFCRDVASSVSPSNLANVLSTAPQLAAAPVSYTIINLRPFDAPAASAATFVGLIYSLILTFYIVMIGDGARNAAGLPKLLSHSGIASLRLTSSIVAYFFLALFYSLLNLAFQIGFTRRFGKAGFVVYWMVNWAGMTAVGLALESLVTILTVRFIPFFMIFWIITNVSSCIFPIETLPKIYRYGYATPFYNVSRAFRAVAFNTRNQLGLNFGILITWILISCITLPLFQWVAWRRTRKTAGSP